MKKVLLFISLLVLAGWWGVSHCLSSSTPITGEPVTLQTQPLTVTPATQPAQQIATDSSPKLESNLPAEEMATTQPSEFRQVRGEENYWRLAQDDNGAWWFLSPTGHKEFLNTVTTVQPYQDPQEKGTLHFVSTDWDGREGKQDLRDWARATLQRVYGAGFKGLGAWCNPAFHQLDVPMSQDLNLWAWVDDDAKRFYTPEWQTMADQAARVQILPLRTNRNLVGYYIDNELDWGDGFAGPGAYFDHLAGDDPNRRQVLGVMHTLWPTLDDFNMAWETRMTEWSQVESWTVLPRERTEAYDKLSSAWLSHLAEDYFRVTTGIIRKYDSHHLILGVRFKGYAPEEVVRASKSYTDAQSLNYYVADARLDADMFRMMYEVSGQPIIISEYSFHSLDGRSDNRDTVGFSGQVPDQQARADGYRLMTTRLARVPYIIGADWFQWCDEPASGRSGDGEDVDFGVVDAHDKPYDQLVDAVRATTPLLNTLHAASPTDEQKDVWRESYAARPVMHVPFLVHPPLLDGSLKGWPVACRLPNVRREETIGLDRSTVAPPLVYMGWNNKGLYLAMEIYDRTIETAPATGWWWTRDNVEFWLSTRPITSDQNRYNINCQQFFFVPSPSITARGEMGVVGQWHRDGDILTDNVIPQPDIRPIGKIYKDRYVVEMFIPARAMVGFNPERQPAMAFNIHVRDFESAADFFWSAPKSVQTQLRPSTWGALYLDSAPGLENLANSAQARAN